MDKKFKFYAVKLSAIIVAVFLLQFFVSGFTELFVLNSLSWIQPWRFLTSALLHGGLGHLTLNLFALLIFGSILEKLVGGKNFLTVFFVTGVLANLVSVNFYSSSLGASGAIFGVLGVLIIMRPGMPVWAFGLPMPMFVAGILWAGADILGTIGFLTGNPLNNTGNIAHLSGMLFGFIFGYLFRKKFKKLKMARVEFSVDEPTIQRWEEVYMRR